MSVAPAAMSNPTTTRSDLLVVDQVDVYYGAVHALQGISLVVREGELVCLLGGNASGKSTTMKTILGLVKPRSGTVTFRGPADRRAEDLADSATGDRLGPGSPAALSEDDGPREPADGRVYPL